MGISCDLPLHSAHFELLQMLPSCFLNNPNSRFTFTASQRFIFLLELCFFLCLSSCMIFEARPVLSALIFQILFHFIGSVLHIRMRSVFFCLCDQSVQTTSQHWRHKSSSKPRHSLPCVLLKHFFFYLLSPNLFLTHCWLYVCEAWVRVRVK